MKLVSRQTCVHAFKLHFIILQMAGIPWTATAFASMFCINFQTEKKQQESLLRSSAPPPGNWFSTFPFWGICCCCCCFFSLFVEKAQRGFQWEGRHVPQLQMQCAKFSSVNCKLCARVTSLVNRRRYFPFDSHTNWQWRLFLLPLLLLCCFRQRIPSF